MAKSIVHYFPALSFNEEGYPPEYLFFNSSNASFIQTRLNTVRSKDPPEQLKRNRTTVTSSALKRRKKCKRPGVIPPVRTTLTADLKSKVRIDAMYFPAFYKSLLYNVMP